MAWRKRLRTASFRKIRFNLTNAEASFGRRTANHEFPKRDEPYTEDMGRKAREFTIEAFIVGTDYMRQRDRLIEACEKSGPGRLVHPYYGNREVVCTGCEIREAANEGGIARFNLSFREAGSLKFPQVKKSKKGILGFFGLAAADAAVSAFTNALSVASQPQALVDSVADKVTEFTEALDESTSFITRNADEIADLAFSISDLRDDVDAIIHTPEVLGSRIKESLSLVIGAVSDQREAFKSYQGFFNTGRTDTFSTIPTTTRAQQTKNLKATNNLLIRVSLGYAAVAAADIEFQSIEEALTYRDSFLDTINLEQEKEETTDDEFQALDQLRVAITATMPPPEQKLSSIIELELASTTNSLVLAYDLYGNLDREADIISRNHVRHPGFIPGGDTLRVLSDG